MIKYLGLLFIGAAFITAPLHAEEAVKPAEAPAAVEEETSAEAIEIAPAFEYSPDYCDFTASYPEQPLMNKHCEDPTKPETCFALSSYTRVFELSSTVRVDVICNPATPAMFEHFTPEVMEKTVRAMTKDSIIEEYKVSGNEKEGYRQTGLVAQGRKGLDKTLYIAQLWVSDSSIMSVEAELSGEQRPEADQLFAKILGNIGYIGDLKGAEALAAKKAARTPPMEAVEESAKP